MSRAINNVASRRRRKKILKEAKGFRGANSKLFRTATEKVSRALQYAYRDRRVKKRNFRALWITRIGIAAQLNGMSYSTFMAGLKKAQIQLDRKVLSDLAIKSPAVFSEIAALSKSHLS